MESEKKIQKKIDLLIDNLGKDIFLELLDFIYEIMTSKFEVKIFISRRFLDLYIEYAEIVEYLYRQEAQEYGKFVTNLSVVMLDRDELTRSNLIIDDIVLHGRALDRVYLFLREECHCAEDKIQVKVFRNNIDAYKISSGLFNCLEAKEECDVNSWREVSSNIIKTFYICGQPYTSYLPYWEIPQENLAVQSIWKIIRENKCVNIANATQKLYGMESYVLFKDQIKQKGWPGYCCQECMIRVYKYNELDKITVIPYVVLNPINEEGIRFYSKKFAEKGVFSKQMIQLPESELPDKELKFVYSALTYILSYSIGIKFLSAYNADGIERNKPMEKYGLGGLVDIKRTTADEIIETFSEGERYFIQRNLENDLEANEDIDSLLEDSIKSIEAGTVKNHMNLYLKLSSGMDEQSVIFNKPRMRGIEFIRFAQKFYNEKRFQGIKLEDIWENIVGIIDSGRGTISAAVVRANGVKYVDSLLYNGEQNFSGNEEELIYYIYPLMRLEIFCEKEKITAVPKEKLATQIADEWERLLYKPGDNEVEQLINKDIYKEYGSYYLEKFPAYEKDEVLHHCMDIGLKLERELQCNGIKGNK